jgi:adenylylsulfate kinase
LRDPLGQRVEFPGEPPGGHHHHCHHRHPSVRRPRPAPQPHPDFRRRRLLGLARRRRRRLVRGRLTARGGIVWLTGLSGAGKSTLASALAERLAGRRPIELVDGDEVRTFLSAGLAFSRADRDTNVRRIAYVARLLANHGVLVIVSAISPYAATRDEVRAASERANHAFVEVYVNASLDTLIARDVKGLYKRARAGEIPSFTGISDPYEPPATPALEVRTDELAPAECLRRILDALVARSLIDA